MCFVDIYKKVDDCKSYSPYELLKRERIDIVRDDTLTNNRQARIMSYRDITVIFIREGLSEQQEENLILHELGHYYFDSGCALTNKRTEENNANLFMCLYLLKNEIWGYEYFDKYLIDFGVKPIVTRTFNDRVNQYKLQVKYGLAY